MKKLLLTLTLTLFISMMMSAQTFTKNYDHFIKKDKSAHVVSELQETNVTVVFSGNDKGDIIILNNSGLELRVDRYYKTGGIYEGTSKDGFKYRYIETRSEKGEKVIMQLFDIGVFRVNGQDFIYEYQQVGN
jgi:hypothetical protein